MLLILAVSDGLVLSRYYLLGEIGSRGVAMRLCFDLAVWGSTWREGGEGEGWRPRLGGCG